MALSLGALGLGLGGCASNTASAITTGGPTNATTTIVGTFRIQGGPYPGINRPLNGPIEIRANTATGRIVARTTAEHGKFPGEPSARSLRGGRPELAGVRRRLHVRQRPIGAGWARRPPRSELRRPVISRAAPG